MFLLPERSIFAGLDGKGVMAFFGGFGNSRREPGRRVLMTASRLVQAAERVLGHDPLEILFIALDAISKPSVGFHRQQRENCIDVALRDDTAALRSVILAKDVVVDMVCVFHGASIVRVGRSF